MENSPRAGTGNPAGASLSPLAADALSDGIRADLARERRRLAADARSLVETTRRLESALAQVSSGARSVADGSSRSDIGADEVARREDGLMAFEQEARMLLERRRILADRVVERRRSIALLEAELATKKAPDALSGHWTILLDPGEQKGVFRLTLDGTIVAFDDQLFRLSRRQLRYRTSMFRSAAILISSSLYGTDFDLPASIRCTVTWLPDPLSLVQTVARL